MSTQREKSCQIFNSTKLFIRLKCRQAAKCPSLAKCHRRGVVFLKNSRKSPCLETPRPCVLQTEPFKQMVDLSAFAAAFVDRKQSQNSGRVCFWLLVYPLEIEPTFMILSIFLLVVWDSEHGRWKPMRERSREGCRIFRILLRDDCFKAAGG